jgi:DNA primase
MRMEGLSFPESVRFLGARVGVEIEEKEQSPAEARRKSEREQLFEINSLVAEYYRTVLLTDPGAARAREYLNHRGVTSETAAAYRLGYALAGRDPLARHLEGKRVPLELAEKLGVVRRSERGGWQDLFRNRLIFVIADPQGRVCGFGGRVLDDGLPKYINSPESPIYRKSDILFGLDLAKGVMREQRNVIIVEGYFDHLGLYQAGIRNVAATCGTALTSGHVKLLSRYAERCYLLFDADSAGRKATFRAMDVCFQENFPARVVTLPEGDDPDSFVAARGAGEFSSCLQRSVTAFEHYLTTLLAEAAPEGLDGRVRAAGEISRTLAKVVNPIERDLYEREAAKRLGIDRTVLRGGRVASVPSPMGAASPSPQKNAGPEEMLVTLVARFPQVRRKVVEYGPDKLFGPELLPVVTALLDGEREVDDARLLELVGDLAIRSSIASLLIDDRILAGMDPDKAFQQCRSALAKEELKDMKSLMRQLAGLDPESPEYRQLLSEMDHLRNKKSQLS